MADLEIQNAFLEGINEVFSIMFTDQVKMFFLDVDKSKRNIYEECKDPVYSDPVLMVAKVVMDVSYDSQDSSESTYFRETANATITIPAKQFIDKGIPYDTELALETLRRCEFEYSGFRFEVLSVTPKTLVADKWQLCDFSCTSKRGVVFGS